jgi:1-acyl-sn-glycerol-3-phosphate acyltransferase
MLGWDRPESLLRRSWWHALHFLCFIWFRLAYRYRSFGVRNVPATGPVLLVCNHQSYLDPIVVGLALHWRVFYAMARSTLFRSWAFGWLIRSLNAIAVERGESDLGAMRASLDVLKAGRVMVIFPEGTRTLDGRVRAFAPGTFLLVKRGGAMVVPVAIEGSFAAWPKGRAAPRVTGRIAVRYGEAMAPQELVAMGPQASLELLRQQVETMREGLKSGLEQT